MEDWLANRTYSSPQPKKILLLFPLLQKKKINKKKVANEIFYSINLTIFNSFEQCKIKIKISTLHDRRSTVILKHQIDFFAINSNIAFSQTSSVQNYSFLHSISLMLYPITWPSLFRVFHMIFGRTCKTGACVTRTVRRPKVPILEGVKRTISRLSFFLL